MSQTASFTQSLSIGGVTYNSSEAPTGEVAPDYSVTVTAGKAGALTTRTSNSQGTATMDDAGHGITTGARVDVYWDGGVRYGMTVGTVSGTSVPLSSSGAGDNLPAADTDLTLKVPQEIAVVVTGDDVTAFALNGPSGIASVTVVAESDNTTIVAFDSAGTADYIWAEAGGVTNPLAGVDVAKVFLSHGDTASQEMRGAFLY